MCIYLYITDKRDLLELENFIPFLSFICGICGYIGLLITLKGLHKTNHLKKFTLIGLGLVAFITLHLITNTKGFWKWVLTFEEPDEWFVGIWPILISIIFLIMIAIDYIKKRKIKTLSNN